MQIPRRGKKGLFFGGGGGGGIYGRTRGGAKEFLVLGF